jgi:hypothetical protein
LRGKPAAEMDRWVRWVESFIRFHKMRHPETMAEAECGAFLTHLLHERRATLPQLAQARRALVFLYRDFLHRPLGPLPVRWTARVGLPAEQRPVPLLDQMRQVLRTGHYARATEEAYVDWAKRFILFHGKRHPLELGEEEIEGYLTYLAVEREVAASTQLQAFHALLFLYQKVLQIELERIDAVRAKRPTYLPIVVSPEEARQVLAGVTGAQGRYAIMARLLYGWGRKGVWSLFGSRISEKTPDPFFSR